MDTHNAFGYIYIYSYIYIYIYIYIYPFHSLTNVRFDKASSFTVIFVDVVNKIKKLMLTFPHRSPFTIL